MEKKGSNPSTTHHTPSPIEKLKKELAKCQKIKEEYLAGWQRARADFINYKREETQRLKNFFEIEKAGIILKILPILDNLQRAKKEISQRKADSNYLKGLDQIEKQFQELLEKEGIEEIKAESGKFDPNFHEAVAIEETEAKGEEAGKILRVVQKGYKLNGKVIRPAKVKVRLSKQRS